MTIDPGSPPVQSTAGGALSRDDDAEPEPNHSRPDARSDAPLGNAALGAIHEFGSPARNIPGRPFLVPGVQGSERDWLPRMEAAARAAIEGRSPDANLGQAGQAAVNGVTQRILSNIPPPLSPKTVAARRQRTRGSSYRRQAATPQQTVALVDTGALLRSLTWVVRG